MRRAGEPCRLHRRRQRRVPNATPVAAAPVRRGLSPLVWILIAVAGIFVLCIVGLVGAGLYVAKNPGMVMGKLITAANPDAELLSTDVGSQTVRIRDRRTGKEVTLSFDDVKKGKLKFSAIGENGEVANVEIGGGEGKMPAWVPTYPGARAQGNMTAKGESTDGIGEGGVVTFTTPDASFQSDGILPGEMQGHGDDRQPVAALRYRRHGDRRG